MSVRRLAEDSVQPASFAFNEANAAWAERAIARYPEGRQQSAVIPLLMRAQEQDGWVTKAAIEHVADRLAMPLIRVLEVATFYTQFQLKPVGTRAHVQVCGTTPCMLRGSDELKAVCRKKIHAEPFHLNESGTLSWEEVECLGACVNAPMVMIFKDTYEDLTPERLEEIIDAFGRGEGESILPGPQIDRRGSAPIGGLTSLTDDGADEGAEGEADSGAAAEGAPPQGNGAGEHVSMPPSKAGRPDSDAAETDPSLKSPGDVAPQDKNEAAEQAASVDPAEGASRPGAGHTGGTEAGPTGAAEKDDEETKNTAALQDRTSGSAVSQGLAAEDQVVSPKYRPDDGGPDAGEDRGSADLTGRDQVAPGTPEALRRSDDVTAGPVIDDSFDEPKGGAPAGHSLEHDGPNPIGRKPEGLLAAPEGEKDDLKRIKGVGPVLEEKLNDLGVYHFRQIAGWDDEELVWIDDHLNFRGRAIRDRWIEQARALASAPSGEGA
ncbi:NADH-quinone oxidoreductase subunit NuoE [Aurantimonas sp. MSK8Z-1]|uniref:NADH-quinone oxidoreductase subunit NuoE n=1 Tax=Mangrovibrevibacter kandeliae TaxID=2968473 RepID=UPI00211944F3|nr:NADH-quinone oxidoreductase subunit NuoE [Aurantimonas sp. MSK8Z-1]MCW4114520.1 NADH-quinone oxidoreductase subunit NuoE [Aurantimonas sp. MSK8Z-1]